MAGMALLARDMLLNKIFHEKTVSNRDIPKCNNSLIRNFQFMCILMNGLIQRLVQVSKVFADQTQSFHLLDFHIFERFLIFSGKGYVFAIHFCAPGY